MSAYVVSWCRHFNKTRQISKLRTDINHNPASAFLNYVIDFEARNEESATVGDILSIMPSYFSSLYQCFGLMLGLMFFDPHEVRRLECYLILFISSKTISRIMGYWLKISKFACLKSLSFTANPDCKVCLCPCRHQRVIVDKTFNIGHILNTTRVGAFIFHMCIPSDKTFHKVS